MKIRPIILADYLNVTAPMSEGDRVLIADPDPGVRGGLYKRLVDADVLTDCVGDGREAQEKLRGSAYAVIVLDLGLPNGSERVLNFIAAMPKARRPVVLVLSPSAAARSLDVEVVQIVLRKPCDLRQLAEMVRTCVRIASTRAAAHGEALTPESHGPQPPA